MSAREHHPAGVRLLLINLHFAAGWLNGHRGARVRALLGVSWRASWLRLRVRVWRSVRRGVPVLITMDDNAPHVDLAKLAGRTGARVVVLYRRGPDAIVAVLPAGCTVEKLAEGLIDGFEHEHPCAWVRIRLTTPLGMAVGSFAVWNSGRAKTRAVMTAAMARVAAGLQKLGDLVAIGWLEIAEGDKTRLYSEADLIAEHWPRAHWLTLLLSRRHRLGGVVTKEPITITRDPRLVVGVGPAQSVVVAKGVDGQSPTRRRNSVELTLTPVTERHRRAA